AIRSDELGVGLAGGVESMSRSGWAFMKGEAPFSPRGPIFMLDTMWAGAGGPPNPNLLARDAYIEMIRTAQNVADRYELTREEIGVEPLARVVASATHALDPQYMGIAPAFAIATALERAGIAPADIDVWEVHEAFAAQALGVLRELPNQLGGFEVPDDRLNPNGGAVAIGHPFGSSGTRYVLTLATELSLRGARYGVLGVCVGSGQGVALVLENSQAA